MKDMRTRLHEALDVKVDTLTRTIRPLFIGTRARRFYIAGGAFVGPPSDIDIFPVGGDEFNDVIEVGDIVFQSPNATTLANDTCPVQFCRYRHPSLVDLLRSFDYAHIQVGAEIQWDGLRMTNLNVQFTDDYSDACVGHTSWFTGSKYPLSSLLRAAKYHRKGVLTRGTYIRAVLDTLPAIIQRGFFGWEDFKDQVDAVDLGLLPEELKEVGHAPLRCLFEQLNKGDKK